MAAYRLRWSPLVVVGLVSGVGLDPARAAQLLDSLRAETTIRSIVAGNFMAVSRLGTFLSVLISVGFLRRWRRAPRVAAEGV